MFNADRGMLVDPGIFITAAAAVVAGGRPMAPPLWHQPADPMRA